MEEQILEQMTYNMQDFRRYPGVPVRLVLRAKVQMNMMDNQSHFPRYQPLLSVSTIP